MGEGALRYCLLLRMSEDGTGRRGGVVGGGGWGETALQYCLLLRMSEDGTGGGSDGGGGGSSARRPAVQGAVRQDVGRCVWREGYSLQCVTVCPLSGGHGGRLVSASEKSTGASKMALSSGARRQICLHRNDNSRVCKR